jgi:hypothetical protein
MRVFLALQAFAAIGFVVAGVALSAKGTRSERQRLLDIRGKLHTRRTFAPSRVVEKG